MKKILTILILLTSLFCVSQTKVNRTTNKPANNNLNSNKRKYSSATTASIPLDTLNHNTCLKKQFSIVFYVVLDSGATATPSSSGVGLATPANLSFLVSQINLAFKPICVSFVNCTTIFIPNHMYGKSWLKNPTESFVTAGYYTDKTINFYLVDSLYSGAGNTEYEGYSYMPVPSNLPPAKKDLLVLDKYKILQGNGAVSIHLLGHFFGLPHTFDEINPSPAAIPPPPLGVTSQEFADGSNCYLHGDGFCDTEADTGDLLMATTQDGMGTFYLFPVDNFMSYYAQRSRFTQEQYNWMAYTIMTKRLYLN